MPKIAILNSKGGSGKTTLCANLARALQLRGYKVLIIDADKQGSIRDWHANGGYEFLPVIGIDRAIIDKNLAQTSWGYDWVLIDGPGNPSAANINISAIKAADIVLIPITPSGVDIWAIDPLIQLIKTRQDITDGQPKAAFLLNKSIPKSRLVKEVKSILGEYEFKIFKSYTKQRVNYVKSISAGKTIFECNDTHGIQEVNDICDELEEFSNEAPNHI